MHFFFFSQIALEVSSLFEVHHLSASPEEEGALLSIHGGIFVAISHLIWRLCFFPVLILGTLPSSVLTHFGFLWFAVKWSSFNCLCPFQSTAAYSHLFKHKNSFAILQNIFADWGNNWGLGPHQASFMRKSKMSILFIYFLPYFYGFH